jgi:hypothetical protein
LLGACGREPSPSAEPPAPPSTVAAPRPTAAPAPTSTPKLEPASDPFADLVPPFERAPVPVVPRGVLDLQTSAVTQSTLIRDADGRRYGIVLIDLAPAIGTWYVLRTGQDLATGPADYHLQVTSGTRL